MYTVTGDRCGEPRPGEAGESEKIETNRSSVGMRSELREDNHLNRASCRHRGLLISQSTASNALFSARSQQSNETRLNNNPNIVVKINSRHAIKQSEYDEVSKVYRMMSGDL